MEEFIIKDKLNVSHLIPLIKDGINFRIDVLSESEFSSLIQTIEQESEFRFKPSEIPGDSRCLWSKTFVCESEIRYVKCN